MRSRLSDLFSFLHFLTRRFGEDRGVQIAASLTYTTLLSLVPLIVIALMVFSAFPMFADLMTALKLFLLSNMLPETADRIIAVYMQQFAARAAHLTAAGLAALAVTALMLMLTIEHAFNLIWRVRTPRPLLQRFLTYWAVLTLGPLSMGASLSLTSYLVSLSAGYVVAVPTLGVVALKQVPLLISVLSFFLLYLAVPNCYVPFRHALAGGLVAGMGMELMNKAFTAYILHFSSYTLVYGAFASLPVFLLWVYLSWLVVVAGAVLAASMSYWSGGAWRARHMAGRRYYDAIKVLRALRGGQCSGESLDLARLQRETKLPLDELAGILHHLREENWAAASATQSWMLARGAGDIMLAEIFRSFVFQPDAGEILRGDPALQTLAARAASGLEHVLAGSLEDLCSGGMGGESLRDTVYQGDESWKTP